MIERTPKISKAIPQLAWRAPGTAPLQKEVLRGEKHPEKDCLDIPGKRVFHTPIKCGWPPPDDDLCLTIVDGGTLGEGYSLIIWAGREKIYTRSGR
ncbi:hypothetical protein RUM44_001549 [Polyplax serrata]|uniref:Uncharacterized protein n=1 Tax=Polyplax serrata TaxID=468196 RepID=A0ABR1AL18_POLSC